MESWEDIFREKFADEQVPLPEGDWEWFEANMLVPGLKRRRRIKTLVWVGVALAAASIALFVLPVSREPSMNMVDNEEVLLAESEPVVEAEPEITPVPEVRIGNYSSIRSSDAKIVSDISPSGTEMEEIEAMAEETEVLDVTEETADAAPETIKEVTLDYFTTIDQTEVRTRKRHVSLSAHVVGFGGRRIDASREAVALASSMANRSTEIANGGALSFGHVQPLNTSYSHFIPVSIGLDVSIPFSPTWAITTGVELSYYQSRFSGALVTRQSVYYLGIPLRLDWTITKSGPLSVYAGSGLKVDRLIYGQCATTKWGAARIKDNRLNWSFIGDLGVQYDLFRNAGLFVSPEVSYYFKPSDPAVITYRDEHPLTFNVAVGMRITL